MTDDIREGDRVEITYTNGAKDKKFAGEVVEADDHLHIDLENQHKTKPDELIINGLLVRHAGNEDGGGQPGLVKNVRVVERAPELVTDGGEPREEAVFLVEFRCRNCENRFKREYPRGTRVKKYNRRMNVYCEDSNSEPGHMTGCDICGVVECELCGLEKALTDRYRSPISQGASADD